MRKTFKTKFIAEISSNHNGNLKRCFEFIKVAKKIGCYGVKFQLFNVDKLFSKEILKKSLTHRKRVRWELKENFIPKIAKECKKVGIKFGCTPFYLEAVDILRPYVDFYKISSYEILWKDLLIKCAKTKKPIMFSSGMANLKEIQDAYHTIEKNGSEDITIFHCISEYPANINHSNLNFINTMKKKFNVKIGWSDHTRDKLFLNSICNCFKLDAVEFHLDLDGMGYEYKSGHCWLPKEISEIINSIDNFQKQLNLKANKKKLSSKEKNERLWRADPSDGLRPFKIIRKKFS